MSRILQKLSPLNKTSIDRSQRPKTTPLASLAPSTRAHKSPIHGSKNIFCSAFSKLQVLHKAPSTSQSSQYFTQLQVLHTTRAAGCRRRRRRSGRALEALAEAHGRVRSVKEDKMESTRAPRLRRRARQTSANIGPRPLTQSPFGAKIEQKFRPDLDPQNKHCPRYWQRESRFYTH